MSFSKRTWSWCICFCLLLGGRLQGPDTHSIFSAGTHTRRRFLPRQLRRSSQVFSRAGSQLGSHEDVYGRKDHSGARHRSGGYLVAGEPGSRLDESKKIARQLATADGLNDEQARKLAHDSKVIVHIDGGLHSSEVAGGQHSIALAYKLVSAKNDPEIDAILSNVILVLWPTLNPDGQDMIVSWYRQNLGTKYEVAPMPWLYQEYVGHDNNRDGYMLNMKEEQVVTKTEIEYSPSSSTASTRLLHFPLAYGFLPLPIRFRAM